MNYFRRFHKHYFFVSLIALGMLIRTFVATGYMLNTQTTEGDLIVVTLCHGPNNINQLPGINQSNNKKSAPDDDKQTTCNLWTSSGTSLALQYFNPDYQNEFSDEQLILYKVTFYKSSIRSSKFARAPPGLI